MIQAMVHCRRFPGADECFLCRAVILPIKAIAVKNHQIVMQFQVKKNRTRLDMSKLTGALCSVLSV